MRIVVAPHDRTRIDGNLNVHMHEVHHFGWPEIHAMDSDEPLAVALDLAHDDDHDDLRRGIGA